MSHRRDQRSPEAQAYRRLYHTARWRRIRAAQLVHEPLCRLCRAAGRYTAATVCDHIEPHRGDEAAFWAGPYQSLCQTCHSSLKQRDEAKGYQGGCDARGRPLDPGSHWYRT